MTNYLLPYHGEEDLSTYSFLVTGGAGFIGSNLVEYLLKYNAGKVRVLDNFSTGFRHNIESFTAHSAFELIKGDIRDFSTCHEAVKGIDFVFHEAALGSVPRSINDPLTTNAVNISGFLNMLQASVRNKVKRVVYAASSSTYGDSPALPKYEDIIGKPLSPYAVTKYVNELYASVYARIYNLDTIGLRYFNVFGKRQAPNGAYAAVIPKFVKQLLDRESPVINGDGTHSRDFTYIDNVVQMNIKAMFTQNRQALNQVYNTAYGEQTSLNELISYLIEYLKEADPYITPISIKYGPSRIGDVKHSLACITKAEKLLDYKPRYPVKDGLKDAIDWYVNEALKSKMQE
ncbi:SDR family oxidoreductase [Mucilaginibacter panaciglaebae]|uniref:SDR family oxidoreductase n=1 Tax=Mucilaginibacter panaciglaebae TaxID=502331 RepID=A0ABP7WEI5_9SPHI